MHQCTYIYIIYGPRVHSIINMIEVLKVLHMKTEAEIEKL